MRIGTAVVLDLEPPNSLHIFRTADGVVFAAGAVPYSASSAFSDPPSGSDSYERPVRARSRQDRISEPRVDRLRFQRQHGEHGFVDAPERFLADRPLE